MNERIKELEKECWSHRVDGTLVDGQLHFDTKKFAELIVQECSRIADDWVNNEDNGKNYPSDKIKQHFGVKE
jgi:hypothetical protein